MKKKTVIYQFDYYIALPTRKNRVIFDDESYIDMVREDKVLSQYLKSNDLKLLSLKSIDNGKGLMLHMNINPDFSISEVVFNFRRFSYQRLKKNQSLIERLHGENSVWTRDFSVGMTFDDALKNYHKLIGGVKQ